MISDKPNNDALRFIEVMSSLAQELTSDELLYLSRSRDFVKEKLQLGEIEFLSEISDAVATIPALQEETLRKVWKKTPFRNLHQGQIPTDIEAHLKEKYPASDERMVMPYQVACHLTLREAKKFIRSDLSHCALTLQQIGFLMREQNFRGRSGPLSFNGNNYVLIKDNKDKVVCALIFWKRSIDYPHARNAWEFWLHHDMNKGRLILAV